MNYPSIVSRDEWLAARAALLTKEKEATRARDRLNAERRRLPMVKIDKDYFFEGPNGKASLLDLFDGRSQLIIYHFMFDPSWDEGCEVCSFLVDNIGHLAHLHARDTSLVLVSCAPLAKIEPFETRMNWAIRGSPRTAAISTTISMPRRTEARRSSTRTQRMDAVSTYSTGRTTIST